MFKVFVSKKLARILRGGIVKVASPWWENKLFHHPETKNMVKFKSLPLEEQKRLNKQHESQYEFKESKFMSVQEVQEAVKEFQVSKSKAAFKRLYQNFLPTLSNIVKRVIGSREYITNKDDVNDLKQAAGLIFVKTITIANPENQGIVNYINYSVQKQLEGKARDVYRSPVSMANKDRRLLRAIQSYMHQYRTEHGEDPTDYEQMARDINKDPKYRVSHATSEIIMDLLKSGTISMDEPVDAGDDDRSRHDVLSPEALSEDVSTITTPEEDAAAKELRDAVKKNIEAIPDDTKRTVLKLHFGLMEGPHFGEEMSIKEIADEIKLPRSTVRRELERAMAMMRRNKNIQKFRESRDIMRIIKSYNRHVRFAYVPDNIIKVSKNSILVDSKFLVRRYANQLVCSCGKDCFHKEAAVQYLRQHG